MVGLFGGKDDGAALAELERLDSLPLEDLAAELLPLMPDVELGYQEHGPTAGELARQLSALPKGQDGLRMLSIIAEGMQLLEHARLVRLSVRRETSEVEYVLTRAGRAALETGDVGTRLRGGSTTSDD